MWVALDVSETFNTGQSCRGRPWGRPLSGGTHGVCSLGENLLVPASPRYAAVSWCSYSGRLSSS